MLKKLIRKLFVFFLLLVILDMIIGFLMNKIYFAQSNGTNFKTTYLLEKATPEIVILGSSRALHHYIDYIIQDSLKVTCYNGGRDGSFILYSNAALNCMVKRYSPKIVILDILEDEFEESSYQVQDRLSCLLPYYKAHPEIRDLINLKSPFEKYKLLSAMYTFNSLVIPSIAHTIKWKNEKNINTSYGYEPLYGTWKGEIKITNDHNQKLESNKIESLRNIIEVCKEKKIKLVIVVSPTYQTYVQKYNASIKLTENIAHENHVLFWNYQQDTTYLNNKVYFKDVDHLNNYGAMIFTADIISKIKDLQ